MSKFDMGGGGAYKRKYGGYEIVTLRLMKAKYPFLVSMRDFAAKVYGLRQKVLGFSRKFLKSANLYIFG